MNNNLTIIIVATENNMGLDPEINDTMIGNKTIIEHVMSTANTVSDDIVIVVSKNSIKQLRNVMIGDNRKIRFKIQEKPLGTGNAAVSAMPCCNEQKNLLVLLGNVPLINPSTLQRIVNTNLDAVIMGFKNYDITNIYSRIITRQKKIYKIIPYSEATPQERKITLCDSGILWLRGMHVPLLKLLKPGRPLSDIIQILSKKDLNIGFMTITPIEAMTINTKEDLKQANQIYKTFN